MKKRSIKATSEAAFTVEFPWKTDGKDVLGPSGLRTQITSALLGSEGSRYIFPLNDEWRRGRVVYSFREEDRAEVVRRFARLGIAVPEVAS